MDAGDREAIDRVIDAVTADFGGIDMLVNNAAVNVLASHFDYDPDMWDWVVRVNLTGPWYLCRRVLARHAGPRPRRCHRQRVDLRA